MSSFREFFDLRPREEDTKVTPIERSTVNGGSKKAISFPILSLPRMFGGKKVKAISDEKLILRTAKRGLSLTLRMRDMKAALMVNDLEVTFLCSTWPELLHEFEKAGFRDSPAENQVCDVLVADVSNYDLDHLYPLAKRHASFVLLGSIEILPSDRVTLIDRVEELRGVIFKQGKVPGEVEE